MELRVMIWHFYAWDAPFKIAFKHNSAERNQAATVLIKLTHKGINAWGEACPREYVTGESVDGCLAFLKNFCATLTATSFDNLNDWLVFKNHWKEVLNVNLAATCAIEMAILDYLSKVKRCSLEHIIGATYSSGPFYYSAIIGDVKERIWDEQFAWHHDLQMCDYKLKLNGEVAVDRLRIEKIVTAIPNASIRLDANNKWETFKEVQDYLDDLALPILGLEEPLKHGSFKALNELSKAIHTDIILDEHACRITDLDQIDVPSRVILNLRVSKCGGVLNTIAMAEYAFAKGFRVIIGAQVGESSLLTRAATLVVNALSQKPLAQEGAYGTNLLAHDLVDQVLQFDNKGELNLPLEKDAIGFGNVTWNESAS